MKSFRILSILLALAMVLSILPSAMAMAEPGYSDYKDGIADAIKAGDLGEGSFGDFQAPSMPYDTGDSPEPDARDSGFGCVGDADLVGGSEDNNEGGGDGDEDLGKTTTTKKKAKAKAVAGSSKPSLTVIKRDAKSFSAKGGTEGSFIEVLVDEVVVAPEFYTLSIDGSGYLQITFEDAYLATLAAGEHPMLLRFSTGTSRSFLVI